MWDCEGTDLTSCCYVNFSYTYFGLGDILGSSESYGEEYCFL